MCAPAAGLSKRRLDHGGRQPGGAATKLRTGFFCTQIGNAYFCLVWNNVIEEPRQLPRAAGRAGPLADYGHHMPEGGPGLYGAKRAPSPAR